MDRRKTRICLRVMFIINRDVDCVIQTISIKILIILFTAANIYIECSTDILVIFVIVIYFKVIRKSKLNEIFFKYFGFLKCNNKID